MSSREGAPEPYHALLVVCGGIAAYKAAEVTRGLQKEGVEVRCVLTEAAERFVGRATFEGLTRQPVGTDEFSYPDPAMRIPHVDLADWADVVVVVPATANVMAKMAAGIADDLATSALLATPAATPIVVAPAMNVNMWSNPATPSAGASPAATRAAASSRPWTTSWTRPSSPSSGPSPGRTWPGCASSSPQGPPTRPSTPCATSRTSRAGRWATPSRGPRG